MHWCWLDYFFLTPACPIGQETNGHAAGAGRIITYGALDGQGPEVPAEYTADFSQTAPAGYGQQDMSAPLGQAPPAPAANPYNTQVSQRPYLAAPYICIYSPSMCCNFC